MEERERGVEKQEIRWLRLATIVNSVRKAAHKPPLIDPKANTEQLVRGARVAMTVGL